MKTSRSYQAACCCHCFLFFGLGCPQFGQLGGGLHQKKVVLSPVLAATYKPASGGRGDEPLTGVSIACGYYHTAVITKQGALVCFGANEYGA